MKKFATQAVKKHNQKVEQANEGGEGLVLPAVSIGALPKAFPLIVNHGLHKAFASAEHGTFKNAIGIDTCANVSVASDTTHCYDFESIESTGLDGIGSITVKEKCKRLLYMRRADGTTACKVETNVLVAQDTGVNVTAAVPLAEIDDYSVNLKYAKKQSKYRQPQDKSAHAIECPDKIPAWLTNRNNTLVMEQPEEKIINLDKVDMASVETSKLVLAIPASMAQHQRLDIAARHELQLNNMPLSALPLKIKELKAQEEDQGMEATPELRVYNTIHGNPSKIVPDFHMAAANGVSPKMT